MQRVLGINQHAGEKGIPANVKNLFPIPNDLMESRNNVFVSIDALLRDSYGLSDKELSAIIN